MISSFVSFIVKHKFWLSFCIIFLIAVVSNSNAFKTRNFHPQNVDCANCHLSSKVSKENAHQLVATQEGLCGNCHANALKVSHPSGFDPNRSLPASYPVDWKGDVTCSTCHQVHGREHGLLRGNRSGREFCLGCHAESFFTNMIDQGRSIHLTGHVAAGSVAKGLDLDPFSMQCLSCHAENGQGPMSTVDARGIVRHASGSGNHPIGMRYGQSKGKGLYRKITDLPASILLPEGKVSCVSCHVGYSKKHGALVASNNRSSLCMECHDI